MNFLTINGRRLAYIEQNPEGAKTVFLIHGNSSSVRAWEGLMAQPELAVYRLVAFDLPAHGESDAPGDPYTETSLIHLAGAVTEAVRQLAGEKPYLLCGASLGANVVAECLIEGLTPEGLIFLGPSVVGGEWTLETISAGEADAGALFADGVAEDIIEETVRAAATRPEARQTIWADYFRTKPPFRTALLKSFYEQQFRDEIEAVRASGLPVLVIYGKEDKFIRSDYLEDVGWNLAGGKAQLIEAAGHFPAIEYPSQVVKYIYKQFY